MCRGQAGSLAALTLSVGSGGSGAVYGSTLVGVGGTWLLSDEV